MWLLILSGDVELNPGPAAGVVRPHEPSGSSPPAKKLNIHHACLCGDDTQSETDYHCQMCHVRFHERCLTKLFSPAEVQRFYRDRFVCTYCDDLEVERFQEAVVEYGHPEHRAYLREIKQLRIDLSETKKQRDTLRLKETTSKPAYAPAPAPSARPNRIVQGKDDPMSNFYRFMFVFRGVIFDCTEKAYQYFKAIKVKDYVLARRIQLAPTAAAAKKLASGIAEDIKFNFELMTEILDEKSKQCRSFRDELRKAAGKTIAHSTYANSSDYWWTTGLNHWDHKAHMGEFQGFNVFGKMLETVRDQLKAENEYETHVGAYEEGKCAYVVYDGEEPIGFRRTIPSQHRRGNSHPHVRRCYYCQRPGHSFRSCWTKERDEYYYNSENPNDIRDPIVRSRMKKWQTLHGGLVEEKSRDTRTFYGKTFSRGGARSEPTVDDLLSLDSSVVPPSHTVAQASCSRDQNLLEASMDTDENGAGMDDSTPVAMEGGASDSSPVSSVSTVVAEPE
jgi:ribA/ribD-fused uncharacterized protein